MNAVAPFLFLLPVVVLLYLAVQPADAGIGGSRLTDVIPILTGNMFFLGVLVIVISVPAAVIGAWLVNFYNFPGKHFFRWGLMLPFACPPYIVAFIYTDMLEYAGPVQTGLRFLFGWKHPDEYYFPEIRSIYSAAIVMAVVFYPYVYMFAKTAMQRCPAAVIHMASLNGYGALKILWKIIVPMTRASIFVGLSLILMETFSDYGTVEFFNVKTYTKAIYDTWLFENNLPQAALLSLCLIGFVFVLIYHEKHVQRKLRFYTLKVKDTRPAVKHLSLGYGILCSTYCFLPILVGFVIPVGWLLSSLSAPVLTIFSDVLEYTLNTFTFALPVVVLSLYAGMMAEYYHFSTQKKPAKWRQAMFSLTYALPGTILGISVLVIFTSVDKFIAGGLSHLWDIKPRLIFSGGTAIIIYAYCMRFFYFASGSIGSAYGQLNPNIDHSAKLFGYGYFSRLNRIYIPLFKNHLLAAGIIIFSDAVKELSIIMVIRPINLDTLSTHVFQLAKAEQFAAAAPGSLVIIAIGGIASYFLINFLEKKQPIYHV